MVARQFDYIITSVARAAAPRERVHSGYYGRTLDTSIVVDWVEARRTECTSALLAYHVSV